MKTEKILEQLDCLVYQIELLKRELKPESESKKTVERGLPEQILKMYNEIVAPATGRNRAKCLNEKRRRIMKKAIKDFPKVSDWSKILKTCASEPWVSEHKYRFTFDSLFEKNRYMEFYEKYSDEGNVFEDLLQTKKESIEQYEEDISK